MNCEIIKDLLPLYVDDCCSEESKTLVKDHLAVCPACRELYGAMKTPTDTVVAPSAPTTFRKLSDWKASLMQSLLLFGAFALITVGVALEARTPLGFSNGFWAFNLVIPATGLLLSLANWYFVRLYPNKKWFSNGCLLATVGITLGAAIWAYRHYAMHWELVEIPLALSQWCGLGILLAVVFCVLSKVLSAHYATLLGKE